MGKKYILDDVISGSEVIDKMHVLELMTKAAKLNDTELERFIVANCDELWIERTAHGAEPFLLPCSEKLLRLFHDEKKCPACVIRKEQAEQWQRISNIARKIYDASGKHKYSIEEDWFDEYDALNEEMEKERKRISETFQKLVGKHHPGVTPADIVVLGECDECKEVGKLLTDLQNKNESLRQSNAKLEEEKTLTDQRLTELSKRSERNAEELAKMLNTSSGGEEESNTED